MKQICERCGREGPTKLVGTQRGEKQTARMCAECVRIVIKPNTNYQVVKK